jgi:hypothetical protein
VIDPAIDLGIDSVIERGVGQNFLIFKKGITCQYNFKMPESSKISYG